MKAVIFDLDGTIIDSHPLHFEAYRRLFAEYGITWSYKEFNEVFAGKGSRAIISDLFTRNGITPGNVDALVQKKGALFREILAEGTVAPVVPGFFEFVAELEKRGIPKTIASGSTRDSIAAMLDLIGARKNFPVYVSVEEVENPKPAPDIFFKAAAVLGVEPGECLVLGDTMHGVACAKAAGMRCIAISSTTTEERLKKAGADVVVPDYFAIIQTLWSSA